MTSGGSGPSLLHCGGGEHLEEDGRKRGVSDAQRGCTKDCEDEGSPKVPVGGDWFCHMAYAYMEKGDVELCLREGGQERASRRRVRHLRE
jgi:hypothetical protein